MDGALLEGAVPDGLGLEHGGYFFQAGGRAVSHQAFGSKLWVRLSRSDALGIVRVWLYHSDRPTVLPLLHLLAETSHSLRLLQLIYVRLSILPSLLSACIFLIALGRAQRGEGMGAFEF